MGEIPGRADEEDSEGQTAEMKNTKIAKEAKLAFGWNFAVFATFVWFK